MVLGAAGLFVIRWRLNVLALGWPREKPFASWVPTDEARRLFWVSEYGATPVPTIKAFFNAILSGSDPIVLNSLADKAMDFIIEARKRALGKMRPLLNPWNPNHPAIAG